MIKAHKLTTYWFSWSSFYFDLGPGSSSNKDEESTSSTLPAAGPASGLKSITLAKSVEFSYEELAIATDNFSLANKIGKSGSGSFYYAELRGEVTNYAFKFCSLCIFLDAIGDQELAVVLHAGLIKWYSSSSISVRVKGRLHSLKKPYRG